MMGMLDCREVHRRVASGDVETMNWMQRIEFRIHILMCVHCRNYVTQIAAIGEAVRRIFLGAPEDPAKLLRMEEEICSCLKGDA